ncbi:YicC/YloC family endoribonuclease [Serpentinimonas maccroryi]|uniref:YicC/YloC family endoribonuclease n=1 Tax=Serpentinimonas maccroryi TaxID=1458426 RepID=UPI0020344989
MPVYSMTGYACASQRLRPAAAPEHAPELVLGVEIRSVNSRFLDLGFRLSDELRASEPALRERVQTLLKRGKVEVRAWVEGRTDAGWRAPSSAELQKLLAMQDQIRTWMPQARELSVAELLQLVARSTPLPSALTEAVSGLFEQVLHDLRSAREREGARLAQTLHERLQQLQALAQQAQPLVPAQVEQQRLRFLERWNEAMGHTATASVSAPAPAAAQERALSEATAYALRLDIAEELTRLQSHLKEIGQLLERGGEVGKRLDFLIQELQREANTLGSKSSSLALTRIAVDMKVLIEQMREQVQNLE